MADEEGGEGGEGGEMEKEVHIVVQVTVRKGEALPDMPRVKTTSTAGDEEDGGVEGGDDEGTGAGEGEGEPKPTLEELGVKFVLSTFNGQSLERCACLFPRVRVQCSGGTA